MRRAPARHILVINSGSSSVKYDVFEMSGRTVLASGSAERIGEPHGRLVHRRRSGEGALRSEERTAPLPDHRAALAAIADALREAGIGEAGREVHVVGHRVVHGGERFRAPARVDREVLAALRRLAPLAPLHNPANVQGIEVCLERFPDAAHVAVFDTAFHQTLPPHAYRYAIPEPLYAEHGLRRYGFHGTSHAYVARRAADRLGRPLAALNLVTLHLGNGASAAALRGGRCIDTSMGLTPLEGLVMGTRCGDIDPAASLFVSRVTGRDAAAVERLLNEESGLRGLCGANDMREILARRDAGDERAALALDVYCYRIAKYIGAYNAVLGRLDGLVFTAGIGENAPVVRARACEGLAHLGIRIDAGRNEAVAGEVAEIHAGGAPVAVLVVRTDEELEIALQSEALLVETGLLERSK